MNAKALKILQKFIVTPLLVAGVLLSGFSLDALLYERGKIVDTLYLTMRGQATIDNFYFGEYAEAAPQTIVIAPLVLTSGTVWVVPSDWDNASNTIEVIGGGGGGDAWLCDANSNCDDINGSAVIAGAQGGRGGGVVSNTVGGLGGDDAAGYAEADGVEDGAG